jgi:hypothetical protein
MRNIFKHFITSKKKKINGEIFNKNINYKKEKIILCKNK